MKYDDNIRHRYVYQNLLHEKADAVAPGRYLPELLPRRKNLNDPSVPSDHALSFKSAAAKRDTYYDTSTDPIYNLPVLGHDVFTTDIMKQKKELGVIDLKSKLDQESVDERVYDYNIGHLRPLYYDTQNQIDRIGGFVSGDHQMNYHSYGGDKPLAAKSSFTYL